MKQLYSLLIIFSIILPASAQKLISSGPYSGNTPFIEPDPRPLMVKISGTEILSLAKVKGGMNGPSDYLLEKYDLSLNALYSIPITATPDEDFVQMVKLGSKVALFIVVHDMYKFKSTLKVLLIDPADGKITEEKIITETEVSKWTEVRYKGAVKETFQNCINACLNPNFIIPFQYQHAIKFSPDSSKILTYYFDYGQKNLVAKAKITDRDFNVISEGEVPIDNNFINYGIFPNNRGDVFILNVDKLGRVVVVQYNLATKANKLLDIQYSNSSRESLVLRQLNDDVVYVANTNVREGVLIGLMYSKFDFNTNLIEKINFYELSVNLKQTVNTAREVNPSLKIKEDWKHYEITNFLLNEYEKIILVLEKREMAGTNIVYDGSTVNTVERWFEKMGKINTEGMMMFAFNRDDEVIWENFYVKSQLTDVNIGLLSASFSLDNTSEGKLRMVYAAPDGPAGTLTALKYVEWDEYTGSRVKEVDLENKDKLAILRSHLVWWDNKLLLVGRKGLIGKKTMMNLYELN